MVERGGRPAGGRAAVIFLVGLILVGIFAPLIANDRPILARVHGRLVAPALADLPLVGRLFDTAEMRGIPWHAPGPDVEMTLRAPIPHSYRGIDLDEALRPPGRSHLLGTDSLGRDLLARIIHGSRPSLLVGFGATLLALLIGGLLGALAGLRGGLLDLSVIRVADTVSCFPPFILALAFVSAAGHGGLAPIIAGIALSRWTGMARYVRGEVLRQRGEETWTAARSTGASLPRLAARHLLPLLIPPLAVLTSFGVAHAIVLESALSFVGLGVEPPTPSWGVILADARQTIDAAWWPVLFPAAALFFVLAALCSVAERAAAGDGRAEAPRG
jgi:peptide/nickel transport system permease protein